MAVLAVIADHMARWPHGAFVGVDVFFVISGYLITGLLVAEFEAGRTISLQRFYARRVRRILPAGLFVIGVTVCATRVLAGIDRYHFAVKDAIAAVLFVANWHFASTGINYFARVLPPSPLQHYWSLSVEEQFYFLWPGLMLGLLLLGRRLRVWRHENTRWVAAVAILGLSSASLAYAFSVTSNDPTLAYFSTLARAWELGVGALVALASPAVSRIPGRGRLVVWWAGMAGVIASLFLVRATPGFPAPWALMPTLSAAAMLGCGAGLPVRATAPLCNPVSEYLGRISYSLYLWHFPVVVLIVSVVPVDSAAYWIGGLVLIFSCAVASFHLLEEPAQTGTWFRVGSRGRLVPATGWLRYAGACALVAVLAAVGLQVLRDSGPTRLTLPAPVLVGGRFDGAQRCLGAAVLDPSQHCAHLDTGNAVAPLPGALPDDTGGAYACFAYRGQAMHPCVYGSRTPGAVRVALVGDSHAAALLAALEPQLAALHWRLTVFTGETCAWVLPAQSPTCPGLEVIAQDLRVGHFAVVIATEIRVDPHPVAAHLAAMRPVQRTGARILVVEDDPSVSPASTACVLRITYRPTSNCGTPLRTAYASPDLLAAAAAALPGARVVDTRRFYCVGQVCPATIGNVIVYRDDAAHVTASYARTLSPYLAAALLRVLPGRLR